MKWDCSKDIFLANIHWKFMISSHSATLLLCRSSVVFEPFQLVCICQYICMINKMLKNVSDSVNGPLFSHIIASLTRFQYGTIQIFDIFLFRSCFIFQFTIHDYRYPCYYVKRKYVAIINVDNCIEIFSFLLFFLLRFQKYVQSMN